MMLRERERELTRRSLRGSDAARRGSRNGSSPSSASNRTALPLPPPPLRGSLDCVLLGATSVPVSGSARGGSVWPLGGAACATVASGVVTVGVPTLEGVLAP